jgi:hypothetical protein
MQLEMAHFTPLSGDQALPPVTLMHEDAPQWDYDLREVFNSLCWMTRIGAQSRMPRLFHINIA